MIEDLRALSRDELLLRLESEQRLYDKLEIRRKILVVVATLTAFSVGLFSAMIDNFELGGGWMQGGSIAEFLSEWSLPAAMLVGGIMLGSSLRINRASSEGAQLSVAYWQLRKEANLLADRARDAKQMREQWRQMDPLQSPDEAQH
ncbi:MAG: hypothetical protein GC199_08965 [Alphaproteobacteria bacterium]|nr:hypothetical protein [Alphaproteobacteria bacterium]